MPQYHLDYNDNARTWNALDAFTQGYIECLFFTEHSPAYSFADIEDDPKAWQHALEEGQSDGQIPGDATFADLSPDALARCVEDCREFQEANAELLAKACEVAGYDMERAGNDYWLTRNGHGAGFWDRGLGDVGDKLSDAARYSTVDVCLGDDNMVHTQ
jgi:hypothetical protein